MGVCGVGKTTVARAMADMAGAHYLEGDDFHPEENVRAMAQGRPLSDADRWPWLESICAGALAAHESDNAPVVIACSALKKRYRDLLRQRLGDLAIIHLTGDRELIRARMEQREGHFMPARLLDSQLRDLEAPRADEGDVLVLDISGTEAAILNTARAYFSGRLQTDRRARSASADSGA
ncbi:gluconokinase [Stappia sp. F7233]|uniref:Gluconokinase n=2 Tax=Stappia albiluteola TaxID=2758565 RepID=A0A839AF51_9HYPH|nr:gluconokinase [Stappia albiluteola]